MVDTDELEYLQTAEDLRSLNEYFLHDRAIRWLEVNRQRVIGNHHFAEASYECLKLYRDGYFIATVMMTQSVAEGIRKFVLERNAISLPSDKWSEQINALLDQSLISLDCAQAFRQIAESYRNDVHHMNPQVSVVPFDDLAKRNIEDLACIEREVFGFRVENGAHLPTFPQYWDSNGDGTVGAFLRIV